MSKILIVEDNQDLRELYEVIFNNAGFTVKCSKEGIGGIMRASDFMPDIILLDLMMPMLDGYEVLKTIKKDIVFENTPIIIFSNLSENKDIEKAIEFGADKYLQKSDYLPQEVVKIVTEVLAEKAEQKQDQE